MLNIGSMIRGAYRPAFAGHNTISECMQREERLRFIVHELSHRTKNLLAIVQAIATQTGRRSVSLEDFQTQFSQRLQGLSRSIDLLAAEDGRGASVADLVRRQLKPFGEVDGVRITATGPAVSLNPEATQNIGLALNELATNASKYGALSVPQGAISVRWHLAPGDAAGVCFRLIWRERDGPEVTPPTRRGFGHTVLQRMTGQTLQGRAKHEFDTCGVSWTLEVPAAAVVMVGATNRLREAGPRMSYRKPNHDGSTSRSDV
jgi:two-component sensor histidine kinase